VNTVTLEAMNVPRWLRVICVGVWLLAGSTSVPRLVRDPHHAPSWVLSFVTFGVLFWVGTDRRASRQRTIVCLVIEAGLAGVLDYLGMPAFEGASFALVAAQLPLVLPVLAAAALGPAQAVVLFLVLPRDYNATEIAKSVGSYLGFATLAIGLVRLFDSERRTRVELARAGERVRIARELHDVLGHHLAALTIQLDLARRKAEGDAKAPLEQAHSTARAMLADVRGTVSKLRNDAVVKAVTEPPVQVSFPAELKVADAACAHVALRCIQEAITNTVKHARAKNVRVVVSREGDELMVTIEDDGAAAGAIQVGNGLRGMRERIEELGGALAVESVAQRGTTVRARLPMGKPS
jgi:signal transduction histidine kinase